MQQVLRLHLNCAVILLSRHWRIKGCEKQPYWTLFLPGTSLELFMVISGPARFIKEWGSHDLCYREPGYPSYPDVGTTRKDPQLLY